MIASSKKIIGFRYNLETGFLFWLEHIKKTAENKGTKVYWKGHGTNATATTARSDEG